jgi:hypothetical protein
MDDRVLRRVLTPVTYRCGHVKQENRGQMSEAVQRQVLHECLQKDCPDCQPRTVVDVTKDRDLWL